MRGKENQGRSSRKAPEVGVQGNTAVQKTCCDELYNIEFYIGDHNPSCMGHIRYIEK